MKNLAFLAGFSLLFFFSSCREKKSEKLVVTVAKDSTLSDTLCVDCPFTALTVKQSTQMTLNELDSIRFGVDSVRYVLDSTGKQLLIFSKRHEKELKEAMKKSEEIKKKKQLLLKLGQQIDSLLVDTLK